jgi:hypothetical protein
VQQVGVKFYVCNTAAMKTHNINSVDLIFLIFTGWEHAGRDSSVGIATRYGLDGPGIQSWWEARIFVSVQKGLGAQPASYTMDTGSFPGIMPSVRGVDHYPHLGLTDSPLCRKCGAEEQISAHILCRCEVLASARQAYLGSFFLEPEDINLLAPDFFKFF